MRMSKATISMVMSTTSFGNASTLGTQPLNSPEGYFHNANNKTSPHQVQPLQPPCRPMPKFDMNLKDLFSEEEIAGRPLTHRSQARSDPFKSGFSLRQPPEQGHSSNLSPETSYQSLQQPQTPSHERASSTASSNYQQQPQSFQPPPPFPTDDEANRNDFSFENLDFLNDFSSMDPPNWTTAHNANPQPQQSNSFGQAGSGGGMMDWDLSFGSGGTTGFEAWDANGEIFDGFFFGGGNSNAY